MDELATLRDKLEKTSGVESSPWSDLGAVGSSDGPQQLERHKVAEHLVHECVKQR